MTETSPYTSAVDAVGDRLIDADQLAEILAMPNGHTVRLAVHRGAFPIPPIRVGRRLRWRVSTVRAWLNEQGSQ